MMEDVVLLPNLRVTGVCVTLRGCDVVLQVKRGRAASPLSPLYSGPGNGIDPEPGRLAWAGVTKQPPPPYRAV